MESITKLARALDIPLRDLFAGVGGGLEGAPGWIRGKPVEFLLVEDDPRHAELIIRVLEKHGITNGIRVAKTGAEALAMLLKDPRETGRQTPPGSTVVLLDLGLPDISGLEVLRRIRSSATTRSIPVIVLTSSRSDDDYHQSLRLGVTAYVTKPVDFPELSRVIPTIGLGWLLLDHR